MKTKLNLLPLNGGAFACLPAREIELENDRILANDVILPWETNFHSTKLWVIGHEFGAIAAVWANCEQDALDELIDSGLGDSFLVPEDEREDWTFLGNAGEPCDLTHAWMQVVRLSEKEDCRLLCAFAEARGNCQKTLYS